MVIDFSLDLELLWLTFDQGAYLLVYGLPCGIRCNRKFGLTPPLYQAEANM